MNKKELSERDICTKFITPALRRAGWNEQTQLREEVTFTKGRVIVRGRMVSRGKGKRADYVLYFKPNIPLAGIEAKDNHCSVGDGLQQALDYATTLKVPFAFSSDGDGFVFHDRTVTSGVIEKNLSLDEFPSPATLWARYREWQGLPAEADELVLQDYFSDGSGKAPRYCCWRSWRKPSAKRRDCVTSCGRFSRRRCCDEPDAADGLFRSLAERRDQSGRRLALLAGQTSHLQKQLGIGKRRTGRNLDRHNPL